MLKPATLRTALETALPELQQPGRLQLFIDGGSIRSTYTGNLSFEYGYVLRVVATAYAQHTDALVLPTLNWLTRNQPELLANADRHKDGFTFEAKPLEDGSFDVTLNLKLTERVTVEKNADGTHTLTHHPEPPLDPYEYIERWQLFVRHPDGAQEEIL